MIARTIETSILNDFNKKKVIVLLGPRQVGKTTLLDTLQQADTNSIAVRQ